MLQYERIDVSEGKEYMVSQYWYFKDIGYKYEPLVCNRCHYLLTVVYDLNDSMILNIEGLDYRCYVLNLSLICV